MTGSQTQVTIPTPGQGSRTLLIVSSLSRGAEPHPVVVRARLGDPRQVQPPAPPRPFPRVLATPIPAPAPLEPPPEPATGIPIRERTFHLLVRDGDVASGSNYVAVAARLRAVGHHVQVYVDGRDAAAVGPELLRELVTTFDDAILPVAARRIGQARDVDGDGRFTILLSDWLTHLAGGRHAVDGFVRGADLDLRLPGPFSNHCDMMYLSTAMVAGPHLRTVLAHEYTHAVTFGVKSLTNRPGSMEEEGWLDEGLAHLVEDLHGFSRTNLDYRISAFLSEPERYRLVVEDYYGDDLFRSHGNRGATYLFLRWCCDRYGPDLLPALLRAPRRGVANLEAATGADFADLFRGWSVAVWTSGLEPSVGQGEGFGSIDLRSPCDEWELAGPRTTTLWPGGQPLSWALAGTASRYLLVPPSPTGAASVTIEAPAAAALQVTALPLPADLAELDLAVRPIATGDAARPVALGATLFERNGMPVRLTSLSWEPLQPGPDPHAAGFRHAGLDALGVASVFGTSALGARGYLASQPFSAAGWEPTASPEPSPDRRNALIVKAVGTDARGRRVAAWAELPSCLGRPTTGHSPPISN